MNIISDKLRVICIDDANRPNEIPTSSWVKLGEKYTIIKVKRMKVQGFIGGVKLAEINNDAYYPWSYFRINRFAINEDLINEMIEAGEIEVEEMVEELV